MSTREMVHNTIDSMTDEQVAALLAFINSMLFAEPDGGMGISDEEIFAKLEEAEASFEAGRYFTEEEFMKKLEELENV